MNTEQLILSLGTILLATHLSGWLFQRIGQPRVIGEMTAGIILGPSLLGKLFPAAFTAIFPSDLLPVLTALSQIGLLLFMFAVGLEVDFSSILKQRTLVVVTSNAGIFVPFVLGMALAVFLYPQFAGLHATFASFSLFMGTAMSITAFPVLARILKERKLLGTKLGVAAISCAAIDDVIAWVLLAALTAMVHSAESWPRLAWMLAGLVLFVIVMLLPVRRAASILERFSFTQSATGLFPVLILIMLAASWTTERLGVHALFGAFVAGVAVPKNHKLIEMARERIETLTLTLLLPLFFVLTGLRTRIDLISGMRAWSLAAAVIAVAILGKLAGAALAARASGMDTKNSIALGVLMNTRGLVELVVLNAALELGVLSPELFTMMVMMALVTTFMTTPILIAMRVQSERAVVAV